MNLYFYFLFMATIYVTGGGTLQSAINLAAAGSTLLVDDGVYFPINVDKNLTISSLYGYEHCIIDGGGVKRCANRTNGLVNLYGFTLSAGAIISGDGQTGNGGGTRYFNIVQDCLFSKCSCYNTAGAYDGNDNTCSCINCRFESNYVGQYAIAVNGYYFDCYFYGNHCSSSGSQRKSIVFQPRHIENCVFENNATGSNGSIIHPNNNTISWWATVRNCIFKNNYCYGSTDTCVQDAKIENCLFYNNGASRKFGSMTQNCGVKNCTFYGNNTNYGEIIRTRRNNNSSVNYIDNSVFTKIDIRGNIYANNQIVQIRNCRFNTYYIDKNNLSVVHFTDCISGQAISSAQFLNPDYENFHLSSTSPYISAGNYELIPPSRKDMNYRFYKDPPSIGCYQYHDPGNIPNKAYPLGGFK